MTEKPFIPRGRLAMRQEHVTHRHTDGTVTFSDRTASFVRTYHNASVMSETVCGTALVVLVTPSTVVTWDHLP